MELAGVNNENGNGNGNGTLPMERNNEKPEVENADDDDNNDDNNNGPNDNNDDALGNGISDIEDETDRDMEEFNMTQTTPVAKKTRSKLQGLNYQEVVSQQKKIKDQHNPFQMDKTKGLEHEKEEERVLETMWTVRD